MQHLEFTTARNGLQTCSYNGYTLHSRFDPDKEAQRFVDALVCEYYPKHILITGPCLNYVTTHLKKRWATALLCAIQYSESFTTNNSDYDRIFLCSETTDATILSEQLFNYLGEEAAFSTFFISWAPSEKAWVKQNDTAWNAIKLFMNKARDVVGTRNWFNHRWMKNMVRFFTLSSAHALPAYITSPIVVCASGPSLQSAIPILSAYRDRFFLLALSSSVSSLLYNNLIPDAVLSTDGGYWATCHLRPFLTDSRLSQVPLWITAEAAVPTLLLSSHTIQYLTYDDPVETWLQKTIEGRSETQYALPVLRNGTVSGTALHLSQCLTKEKVFFCGLDLQCSNSYQHIQPNVLEQLDSVKDSRLCTLETRQTPRCFSSGSLSLYRNWFCTRKPEEVIRVQRVISQNLQKTNKQLGGIRDITPEQLSVTLQQYPPVSKTNADFVTAKKAMTVSKALRLLRAELYSGEQQKEVISAFCKAAALPEFLMAQRDNNPEQQQKVVQKADALLNELICLAENLEKEN